MSSPAVTGAGGPITPYRPASCAATTQIADHNNFTSNVPGNSSYEDPAKTWNPNASAYFKRKIALRRNQASDAAVALPSGFPAAINNCSLVWSGNDLAENEYIRILAPGDIAEIEAAVKHFTSRLPMHALTLTTSSNLCTRPRPCALGSQ